MIPKEIFPIGVEHKSVLDLGGHRATFSRAGGHTGGPSSIGLAEDHRETASLVPGVAVVPDHGTVVGTLAGEQVAGGVLHVGQGRALGGQTLGEVAPRALGRTLDGLDGLAGLEAETVVAAVRGGSPRRKD